MEKYFAVLHWVIQPEHRFHTFINYKSTIYCPPQLYTSLCLKKKKEDKTYQTPTHLLVRSKHKNSPGPAESWLSLFMYVTATNAKAHCILLNANPISKKGGLKTNQNWVISPKSDQKNNFQSICLRACLYHSLYVLIKMPF